MSKEELELLEKERFEIRDKIGFAIDLYDRKVITKEQLSEVIGLDFKTGEPKDFAISFWGKNIEENYYNRGILIDLSDRSLIPCEVLLKKTLNMEMNSELRKEKEKTEAEKELKRWRTIRVAKIVEKAKIPTRKHSTDAGMDVYSLEDSVVAPFSTKVLKTGITIEFPRGYVAFVWPKGRSAFKVGAGVIDADYQGEVLVKIINHMATPIIFEEGEAIAQIVIVPVFCPFVYEVPKEEIHKQRNGRKNEGIVTQIYGDEK